MDKTERERALSLYQGIIRAWNLRNAEEFAAAFAEDANVVGFDGSPMNGSAEIGSTLRDIFNHHPTAAYVAKIRGVRALGPGVVLVRAVVGMVPPGTSELNPAVNALQSVVVAGQGAEARIVLFHNTPAAFHGRPELVEQLTRELTEVLNAGHTVALP